MCSNWEVKYQPTGEFWFLQEKYIQQETAYDFVSLLYVSYIVILVPNIFCMLTQRTLCLKLKDEDVTSWIVLAEKGGNEIKVQEGQREGREGWRMKWVTEVTDDFQRYFCDSCKPDWIMYLCKRDVSMYTPYFPSCSWYTYSKKQPRKNKLNSVSVERFKSYIIEFHCKGILNWMYWQFQYVLNSPTWSLQNMKLKYSYSVFHDK
jgi:hypothetical protein